MNLIAFVFGLLLIFTCTFSLSFQKLLLTESIDRTYRAHRKTSQALLNTYESHRYQRIPAKKKPSSLVVANKTEVNSHDEIESSFSSHQEETVNRDCARLNLWPLLEEKENQKTLYQTAAQLIRFFYAEHLFPQDANLEYTLLNSLLKAAVFERKKTPETLSFCLENLSLLEKKETKLSLIYYQMLKGTKKAPLEKSYPSFLELFTLEKKPSLICLHHASPSLLIALFGSQTASKIKEELLKEGEPFQKEQLYELCLRKANKTVSNEFLDLFDLQKISHRFSFQDKKTLVQDGGEVFLKKKVFFAS